jgi:hypothetical protein
MSSSGITELEYIQPTLQFSELRISTITTTAHVGTLINLDNIYNQIQIMHYWDLNDGILKMEFKGNTKGTSFKDIMLKAKDTKKSFFNQATLVVRREISPLNWKEINVKLFRNGGIQMTGVRSIEMSADTLRWLIRHLNETCIDKPIFDKPPAISKEQIQLINTDFSIGAKVRRDVLHRVLSETYNLNSSYESAIYQGVKTKYFYNAMRPAGTQLGICPCDKLCKGTGDGTKLGDCKKITISPFQTGQIIITGARTMDQINEAYTFIKSVFTTHANDILRKVYVLPSTLALTTPVPDVKVKKTTVKTGWIQHPCPRNVFKVVK